MSNPVDNPNTRDFYTLDGRRSPGVTKIAGGGERDLNWQKQQGVLTIGASTILRYEEIAEVSYIHTLWLPEHFSEFDAFADMLNAAVDVRPPKAWILGDERLKHCRISAVSLRKLGPELVGNPGGPWTRSVTLLAFKKPKPLGGVAQAPKTQVERDIVAEQEEGNRLRSELAAAKKAAREAKGAWK